MNISPVKKTSVSDQVFEQLKANLIDGTWKQGEKIPSENELANAFQVSRVTARQALSRLATLGLIETRLGEGSFVREVKPGDLLQDMIPSIYLNYSLSPEAVQEVLEFRILYEVEVAGLAAQRITPELIQELELHYQNMKMAEEIECYTEEDLLFHTVLAKATGNSLVQQLSAIMNDILRSTISRLTENVGTDNGLQYHAAIINSCKEKNWEKAKKEMSEHLKITLTNYQNSLK